MYIDIPIYNDSDLRIKIDKLEIRIKKLEGYRLVLKKDLSPSQIGFLIGFGDGDELTLLQQGIYEWKKE